MLEVERPSGQLNTDTSYYNSNLILKFIFYSFVILEISPVYPEDCGQYSCRAYNDYGEAVTSATMKVAGKRSIIMESQLPKGMEGEREVHLVHNLPVVYNLPCNVFKSDTNFLLNLVFEIWPSSFWLRERTFRGFKCVNRNKKKKNKKKKKHTHTHKKVSI